MGISNKKGNLTQPYTIDKNNVIFGFFRFMNLFEVVVGILISQLLRGLPLELTMLKPVFDGKFSATFWGVIFSIFGF